VLCADEVCGFTVYKWRSDLPFKIVLLDRHTGDAKLVLAEGERLDYELRRRYSFDVAAYDCQTGKHAPRYLRLGKKSRKGLKIIFGLTGDSRH